MSTSYQQIDTRLEGVENALMFLMRMIKVRQQVGSPLGLAPVIEEVDMFTIYQRALANGIQAVTQVEPTNEQVENGQLVSSGE